MKYYNSEFFNNPELLLIYELCTIDKLEKEQQLKKCDGSDRELCSNLNNDIVFIDGILAKIEKIFDNC